MGDISTQKSIDTKLSKVEAPEITRVHSGADSPQTKVSNECEVGGTQFSLPPSPTSPQPVNQIPKDTWPDHKKKVANNSREGVGAKGTPLILNPLFERF